MENRPKIHKLHVVFLMCVLTMLMGKAHATSQVQQASNYDISGNIYSSFTATFNSATTAGDAIIVGITYGNTNPTISATDTRGDTFVLAVKTWDFRHNQGSAILYATAINGGSANTVTVNFGNSVAYLGMGIHEYSGLASSSALDIAVGKLGSGSNPTAGSTTSTANGDLIFSCGVEDAIGHGDTFTAGPGFSKSIDLGQTAAYADEDTVQVSAGAFTAGWTLSPRSDWIVTMAAFKGAGDGSGTTGGGTTGPQISSLSPTSGSVGTAVTITGTNFGSTQGTSTVTFNGTAAAATNWSSTKIVAPVPSGATTGNVVVTVAGQFRQKLRARRWQGIHHRGRRVRFRVLGQSAEIPALSAGRSDHHFAGIRSCRHLRESRRRRGAIPAAGESRSAARANCLLGGKRDGARGGRKGVLSRRNLRFWRRQCVDRGRPRISRGCDAFSRGAQRERARARGAAAGRAPQRIERARDDCHRRRPRDSARSDG